MDEDSEHILRRTQYFLNQLLMDDVTLIGDWNSDNSIDKILEFLCLNEKCEKLCGWLTEVANKRSVDTSNECAMFALKLVDQLLRTRMTNEEGVRYTDIWAPMARAIRDTYGPQTEKNAKVPIAYLTTLTKLLDKCSLHFARTVIDETEFWQPLLNVYLEDCKASVYLEQQMTEFVCALIRANFDAENGTLASVYDADKRNEPLKYLLCALMSLTERLEQQRKEHDAQFEEIRRALNEGELVEGICDHKGNPPRFQPSNRDCGRLRRILRLFSFGMEIVYKRMAGQLTWTDSGWTLTNCYQCLVLSQGDYVDLMDCVHECLYYSGYSHSYQQILDSCTQLTVTVKTDCRRWLKLLGASTDYHSILLERFIFFLSAMMDIRMDECALCAEKNYCDSNIVLFANYTNTALQFYRNLGDLPWLKPRYSFSFLSTVESIIYWALLPVEVYLAVHLRKDICHAQRKRWLPTVREHALSDYMGVRGLTPANIMNLVTAYQTRLESNAHQLLVVVGDVLNQFNASLEQDVSYDIHFEDNVPSTFDYLDLDNYPKWCHRPNNGRSTRLTVGITAAYLHYLVDLFGKMPIHLMSRTLDIFIHRRMFAQLLNAYKLTLLAASYSPFRINIYVNAVVLPCKLLEQSVLCDIPPINKGLIEVLRAGLLRFQFSYSPPFDKKNEDYQSLCDVNNVLTTMLAQRLQHSRWEMRDDALETIRYVLSLIKLITIFNIEDLREKWHPVGALFVNILLTEEERFVRGTAFQLLNMALLPLKSLCPMPPNSTTHPTCLLFAKPQAEMQALMMKIVCDMMYYREQESIVREQIVRFISQLIFICGRPQLALHLLLNESYHAEKANRYDFLVAWSDSVEYEIQGLVEVEKYDNITVQQFISAIFDVLKTASINDMDEEVRMIALNSLSLFLDYILNYPKIELKAQLDVLTKMGLIQVMWNCSSDTDFDSQEYNQQVMELVDGMIAKIVSFVNDSVIDEPMELLGERPQLAKETKDTSVLEEPAVIESVINDIVNAEDRTLVQQLKTDEPNETSIFEKVTVTSDVSIDQFLQRFRYRKQPSASVMKDPMKFLIKANEEKSNEDWFCNSKDCY